MTAPNRPHHHTTPYSLCTQYLSPNPQSRTPRISRGGFCDVNERSVGDRRIVGHDQLYRNRLSNRTHTLYCMLARRTSDVLLTREKARRDDKDTLAQSRDIIAIC